MLREPLMGVTQHLSLDQKVTSHHTFSLQAIPACDCFATRSACNHSCGWPQVGVLVPQSPAAHQAAQQLLVSQFPVMQQGAPAQQQLMQNYYQQQQQQQQMMAQQAAMQQKAAGAAGQQKQQAPAPPQPQPQQSAAQPAQPQEQVVRALWEGIWSCW